MTIAFLVLLACKPREAHHSPPKGEDAQVTRPEQDARTADARTADARTADAMNAGPRYLIAQMRCTLEPRRPGLAAIAEVDVVLAIPEREIVTFQRELEKSIDQQLVVFARGWAVAANGMVETDVDVWCLRRGGSFVGDTKLAAELGYGPITGGHRAGGYEEETKVRFLEITSTPPAGALRGVPDTAQGQRDKQLSWRGGSAPRYPVDRDDATR